MYIPCYDGHASLHQSPSECGLGRREDAYSRGGNHPLRVIWEGVKRAGEGVASPLCDAPMGKSDEDGRASCRVLLCDMYVHDRIVWGMECEFT